MNAAADLAVTCMGVGKQFRRQTGVRVQALTDVSMRVRHGALAALVGPDGAGKTTLLRLLAGLMPADAGTCEVLGFDVAREPQEVQDRIAYMPQRFGLYEDLTVQENLDLYSSLHAVTEEERRTLYPQLLQMTALAPFTQRLAGRLSGGMKQKLGLACTLVHSPALLLLDEPTVGVDPLSRRELWEIIVRLIHEQHLTVLLATSYLDEAERCDQVLVLRDGRVLASGHPLEITGAAARRTFEAEPRAGEAARNLQARLLGNPAVIDAVPHGGRVRLVLARATQEPPAGLRARPLPPSFEDGFMVLLHEQAGAAAQSPPDMQLEKPIPAAPGQTVIQVQDLVRRFGAFTAVNHVSFSVRRGEIFGLLGPNGAGKTTTFRMLCGLLSVTSGTLELAGRDLRTARAAAREQIGYVAQKFSLYGALTVTQNLEFFASAYGLNGQRKRERIAWAMRQFDLQEMKDLPSGELPGGYKQRLAMAVALLHEPPVLFLDEPTSGADPLARREFWKRITLLGEQGVTVIVTTHFMEEAEYCDRIAILDAGRVLAQGTPAEVRQLGEGSGAREPSMEDAFIAIVERARSSAAATGSGVGT